LDPEHPEEEKKRGYGKPEKNHKRERGRIAALQGGPPGGDSLKKKKKIRRRQ